MKRLKLKSLLFSLALLASFLCGDFSVLAKTEPSTRLQVTNAGRYSYRTLPSVEKEVSTFEENQQAWYLIVTKNFAVEIENNETFGVKTAELLEGFRLFFIQEMKIPEFMMLGGKLGVKIFKGSGHYHAYCEANNITCEQTIGVSHVSGNSYTKRHKWSAQRQILFFWDKDWRKFWDLRQIETSKRRYYSVLFHEATHQLLDAYTEHGGPRWLEEGLAGYFENAMFDGKEIFLPKQMEISHGVSVRLFLDAKGDPRDVFFWGGRNPLSESANYRLAASFVTLLMRNKPYRPYLDRAVAEAKKGSPDSEISQSILDIKDEKMWALWNDSLKKL